MVSGVYRTPEERFAGLPDFPFEPHYAALIPGSRFSLISGAGHFLQEEKGPEIAHEILAFVPD